jgi:two-component system, NtrC family, response regulator HydG
MSKGNVLLVDDDPEIVEQFARALRNEGYEVDTAFSGEEAWEKYQKRYYDVVVTDWKMQEMDGLELLHNIDQMHPALAKVIVITGFGDEDSAIEAHHSHAFDYLNKPVSNDDLLDKVGEAIERKDGVIAALEDWVETHPEESSVPIKAVLSGSQKGHFWSAKEILEEIKGNTERGRQEYKNLVQLTIDLLTRGKIK